MYYGLTSPDKKKIKDIKSHYHTAMFLLRKFVKLDEIIELNFPSDPTEIRLLLVTEILWLFSLFVPSSWRVMSILVTTAASWACSFLLQTKASLKLFSVFQLSVWRISIVASRDFHQNGTALCAAKLWGYLQMLLVLRCLFILGWPKIARKKVVHAWQENIHTRLQWIVAISLRHYFRNTVLIYFHPTLFSSNSQILQTCPVTTMFALNWSSLQVFSADKVGLYKNG